MIFADVGLIENYWRELLLGICQPIYKLIVYLYELFEVVGTASIITSETLTTLYNRVGMILGLYMMFRLIFSFIQMLINPDYITDKEKGVGNLAKKAILVVALLGITPFLFNKAFEIQNMIVGADASENVIAKLIFPNHIVKSENFGVVFSAYLFQSFYRYDDLYTGNDCYLLDESNGNTVLFDAIVMTGGSVGPARYCLTNNGDYTSTYTLADNSKNEYYKISFTWNGLFAIIVGLVVCYTLLIYTLQVGARVIQLAFLRIISPMAILGYLSPKKDTIFEKWLKMCATTYIDLFIRMAIIYFVVFVINAIIGSSGFGVALARDYDHMWIVNIVMIIALLLFAKKAPELMKELFPRSGAASLGFGLKSPKSIFNDMAFSKGITAVSKRGYGAVSVGVRSGIRRSGDRLGEFLDDKNAKNFGRIFTSGVGGLFGGAARGLSTKDRNARRNAVIKGRDIATQRVKRRDAGYGIFDEMGDTLKGSIGLKTEAKRRAEALDMSIYASQQNRSYMVEEFRKNQLSRITDGNERQLAYELSNFNYDSKTGKYRGTFNKEYIELSEDKFRDMVRAHRGPIDENDFINYVNDMSTLTSNEVKAGKQKAALEKQAQKKDGNK